MSEFQLDERLEADSSLLATFELCELRLMQDSRWPWLILVPRRAGVAEIFDLDPYDQNMLTMEVNVVGAALKKATGAEKINIAAIGNIVRQLHVHVIARSPGDANWPGPVWGHGTREAYADDAARTALVHTIMEALAA